MVTVTALTKCFELIFIVGILAGFLSQRWEIVAVCLASAGSVVACRYAFAPGHVRLTETVPETTAETTAPDPDSAYDSADDSVYAEGPAEAVVDHHYGNTDGGRDTVPEESRRALAMTSFQNYTF